MRMAPLNLTLPFVAGTHESRGDEKGRFLRERTGDHLTYSHCAKREVLHARARTGRKTYGLALLRVLPLSSP
jgi:hypothetical protein